MVGKVRLQRHHPLLQLCRQRLDLFCEQRGEEVFAHRTRHRSPISGSVLQRQRQGRPVILVADPRQGLLLGRPQHAVFHNLDNQQQAEQSLSADLLIETS